MDMMDTLPDDAPPPQMNLMGALPAFARPHLVGVLSVETLAATELLIADVATMPVVLSQLILEYCLDDCSDLRAVPRRWITDEDVIRGLLTSLDNDDYDLDLLQAWPVDSRLEAWLDVCTDAVQAVNIVKILTWLDVMSDEDPEVFQFEWESYVEDLDITGDENDALAFESHWTFAGILEHADPVVLRLMTVDQFINQCRASTQDEINARREFQRLGGLLQGYDNPHMYIYNLPDGNPDDYE